MARIDDQGDATPKRRKTRIDRGLGLFTDSDGVIAHAELRRAFWDDLQRLDDRVTAPILHPDVATCERLRSAPRRELKAYVVEWATYWDIAAPALVVDALDALHTAIHPPLRRENWGDGLARIQALDQNVPQVLRRLAWDVRFSGGLQLDWDPLVESREHASERLRRAVAEFLDHRERTYAQRAGDRIVKTRSMQVDSMRWLIQFQVLGWNKSEVARNAKLTPKAVRDGMQKASELFELPLRSGSSKFRPELSRARSTEYSPMGESH